MNAGTVRVLALLLSAAAGLCAQNAKPANPDTSLARLITEVRAKAKTLDASSGMRLGFKSFMSAQGLQPGTVSYPDHILVRLLFEATRDAGFWNLHWAITNMPPNSDRIWQQWKAVKAPSALAPTATAECDELSALYAFLVGRAGIHGVGLFWPASNHTIAVWVLHPYPGVAVRVVVPTTQIFLSEADYFGTRRFNPWSQKGIYEYTRRDVPDSFAIPKPLFDFMLQQIDKYAGASDSTLQRLRYLRESVFLRYRTPESAAREALRAADSLTGEDQAACKHFAQDAVSFLRR